MSRVSVSCSTLNFGLDFWLGGQLGKAEAFVVAVLVSPEDFSTSSTSAVLVADIFGKVCGGGREAGVVNDGGRGASKRLFSTYIFAKL
jgi:hypothetical protein